MRLLIAAEYFPSPYKGYIDSQAACFAELGAEVSFVAFGRWSQQVVPRLAAVAPRIAVRYVPHSAGRPRELLLAGARAVAAPLRSLALARRVVQTHGPGKGALGEFVRGLAVGTPDADVCLVHDLSTLVALGSLRLAAPDLPIALWYHGGEVPGTPVLDPTDVRRALSRVSLAVANTEYAAEHLAARGMPRAAIHVHRLGIYAEDFPFLEERTFLPEGVLRLLFVGRISAEKGVDDLVEAMASLPDGLRDRVRLRVVGHGLQSRELQADVDRRGIGDRVTFLGVLDHDGVRAAMAESDLLVLPSKPMQTWEENQGMVLQEAMLTGLPVLTTRSGGMREVVPDALAGALVEPGDVRGFIDRFEEFLGRSPEDWRALSRHCAEWARHEVDMCEVTPPVLELLANLA